MISIIIWAIGTISKSLRKYLSNIPANDDKELKKTDLTLEIALCAPSIVNTGQKPCYIP